MKLNFARDVSNWWNSLTPSQTLSALRWIRLNPPSKDWRGTVKEWAYLNMPPEVTQ